MNAPLAMPVATDCVAPYLIERRAAETPDAVFAVFNTGAPDWTFAGLRDAVRAEAAALKAQGVGPGDMVLVWLPNGPDVIRIWLAINWLGATFAPVNTAYRGKLLEHVVTLAGARLMLADAELAPRLAEIDAPDLETVVVLGDDLPDLPNRQVIAAAAYRAAAGATLTAPAVGLAPWDIQALIYTSGTTGPSKGVLCPYLQLYLTATESTRPFTPDDRSLVHSPLFHITAMSAVMRALASGGSIAVLDRFSTATFWRDVRALGATFSVLMGSVATFLLKQDPSADERATPLKTLLISPLTAEGRALAARIGADFHTVFSMSETSRPLVSDENPTKNGTCGRPRRGIEARVVDAHDCEVPQGQVGELILRSDLPWAITPGYHRNPEATARAWRNGWFHTGDAFFVDADGEFHFADRIKDAIRRRGENISSFEVEIEVNAHPDVADCAAVAVPAAEAEDEVLVVIEPRPGAQIDPAGLIEFLAPRMAHFMIPRYLRIVETLPRTPTLRVQKHLLRDAGITPDTWDRESAGIRVGRTGVTTSAKSKR